MRSENLSPNALLLLFHSIFLSLRTTTKPPAREVFGFGFMDQIMIMVWDNLLTWCPPSMNWYHRVDIFACRCIYWLKHRMENDNTIKINLKIQNAVTEPKKKEENDKDKYWPLQEIKPQYGEWITDTVSNAKLITTVSKVKQNDRWYQPLSTWRLVEMEVKENSV